MSSFHQLILRAHPVLLGIFVIGGAAAFAVAGVLTVRRFVHYSKLKNHHDVADPILGAAAAVYAVLIAFVVVIVWQNFDKSNANVQLESNYLSDVYRDAEALSPEFQKTVGELLRQYRAVIIESEWKAMEDGEMSSEAEALMRRIWTLYTKYRPEDSTERIFFDESVRKLNLMRELRRQRIMDSRTGLEPMLWLVLIVGGMTVISFTFFFGAENVQAQIIMAVLLSVTISMSLFTILEMDFPFKGHVGISPAPFVNVLLD